MKVISNKRKESESNKEPRNESESNKEPRKESRSNKEWKRRKWNDAQNIGKRK